MLQQVIWIICYVGRTSQLGILELAQPVLTRGTQESALAAQRGTDRAWVHFQLRFTVLAR